MCEDCRRRAVTNPLRVLDCKVPGDQPIIAGLPRIWDSLDEASRAHFAAVCTALDACGIGYEHDHRLVRGLDYYTRTTFEFVEEAGGTAERSERKTHCLEAAATMDFPRPLAGRRRPASALPLGRIAWCWRSRPGHRKKPFWPTPTSLP